jgi:hypothetical protein
MEKRDENLTHKRYHLRYIFAAREHTKRSKNDFAV